MRFLALDLNHLSDQGTTWQTCHSPATTGEQFAWFQRTMKENTSPFLVTLYNERNSTVRGLEGGAWARLIQQGSAAITGFGYFAERAEVEGFPYFNTAVNGTGTKYADPKSAAFFSEDNFVLLTVRRGAPTMTLELRNLRGETLDSREIPRRSTP